MGGSYQAQKEAALLGPGASRRVMFLLPLRFDYLGLYHTVDHFYYKYYPWKNKNQFNDHQLSMKREPDWY